MSLFFSYFERFFLNNYQINLKNHIVNYAKFNKTCSEIAVAVK